MSNGPLREVPEMRCLSVLLAVYNVEGFIRASVDSILHQDFNDYELIIVDDGSTDQSGKICDEYAKCHPRISVIHKNNGGLSTARNAGIDVARGKYIVFVDADDTLPQGALGTMVEKAKKNVADIHVFGFTTVHRSKAVRSQLKEVDRLDYSEALKALLSYRLPVTSWGKLYSREVFEELRFNPAARTGQDLLFNLDCIANKKLTISMSNEVVYNYILRENSVSFKNDFYLRYTTLIGLVESSLRQSGVMKDVWPEFRLFQVRNIFQAAFKSGRLPPKPARDLLLDSMADCEAIMPPLERRIARLYKRNRLLGDAYLSYRLLRMRLARMVRGI